MGESRAHALGGGAPAGRDYALGHHRTHPTAGPVLKVGVGAIGTTYRKGAKVLIGTDIGFAVGAIEQFLGTECDTVQFESRVSARVTIATSNRIMTLFG